MNLCIVFDRDTEALPTLPIEVTDAVHWIPCEPGFERLLGHHRATLVVLDLRRMAAQAGETVARVRLALPNADVLVLGAPHDLEAAEAAMRAGAAGYITRPANLVPALRAMRNERLFITGTGRRAITHRIRQLVPGD
jgi:DNA-binding NarL/FixJ family response regulator